MKTKLVKWISVVVAVITIAGCFVPYGGGGWDHGHGWHHGWHGRR